MRRKSAPVTPLFCRLARNARRCPQPVQFEISRHLAPRGPSRQTPNLPPALPHPGPGPPQRRLTGPKHRPLPHLAFHRHAAQNSSSPTRSPANRACRGASRGHPPGWTGAATPNNLSPLTHIRHSPNPSSPTPIGDPGGRGYPHQPATQPHPGAPPSHTTGILATRRAGPRSGTHGAGYGRGYPHQPPTHYPHPPFPQPVVPDPDPVPTVGRGTGAATPPTSHPLPTSAIPPTRRAGATQYPRWGTGRARLPPSTSHPATPPSPVVPDSDPVPMARGTGAATPPTSHTLPTSGVLPTRRAGATRYPRWGAGRARLPHQPATQPHPRTPTLHPQRSTPQTI